MQQEFQQALNRTILELKCGSIWSTPCSCFLLSIVPYWNWNLIYSLRSSTWHKLSIVPYWNWNISIDLLPYLTCELSIVPYWNWNVGSLRFRGVDLNSQSYHTGIEISNFVTVSNDSLPLNRTILELKWWTSGNALYLFRLSIVPYWNWNAFSSILVNLLLVSQSYHTGIEI